MKLHIGILFTLSVLIVSPFAIGAEDAKPLKVLFVMGGGYHDYAKQAPYLTEKLSERVNVQIDIVSGGKDSHSVPEIFSDPKFWRRV